MHNYVGAFLNNNEVTISNNMNNVTHSCSYHPETVYHRQREQHEVDGEATDMVTSDPPPLTKGVWLSSVSMYV